LPASRSELAFADLIESAELFAGIADPSREPFIATLEVAPCGLDWAEQFAGQRFAIPRAIVNAATDDPTLIRTVFSFGILFQRFDAGKLYSYCKNRETAYVDGTSKHTRSSPAIRRLRTSFFKDSPIPGEETDRMG
jgi:hypothetical protein